MKLVTEQVEIVARGQYDADNPEYGEFVRVKDENGDVIRYSLDKSVNGDVKVGMRASLALVARNRARAHEKRGGGLGVHYETKYKVVGVAA